MRYFDYLNLLVMPTDDCNMNCSYCFHRGHHTGQSMMDLATLDNLFRITINSYKDLSFLWHGGEPLLMGLDFYKNAVIMQRKYNTNNTRIKNRVQTNLTLMNNDFAKFFVANKFSVGSSFDEVNNNETRGNSGKILDGRRILMQNGGKCGCIMVISKKNKENLIESYEYFKKENINFSMNFYLNTYNNESEREFGLESKSLIKEIINFYEYWFRDKDCNIEVNYFTVFMEYFLFSFKSKCTYTSCLGKWIGIRYNGDIIPCNRYFPDEFCMGNVNNMKDISEAFETDGFKRILIKSIQRRETCKSCYVYNFCNGGCNNVALNTNGIVNNGGIMCDTLCGVYTYIEQSLKNYLNQPFDILSKDINPTILKMFEKKGLLAKRP
jgi:uncharacterized protein